MADPKLKEALAEIKGVCRRHDIAAYIVLVSETHAELAFEATPTWAATFWEDPDKTRLRFQIKSSELGKDLAHKKAESTCHMFYQINDHLAQGFMFTEHMKELIEQQLDVEHESYSGFEPHREN